MVNRSVSYKIKYPFQLKIRMKDNYCFFFSLNPDDSFVRFVE